MGELKKPKVTYDSDAMLLTISQGDNKIILSNGVLYTLQKRAEKLIDDVYHAQRRADLLKMRIDI